VAKNIFAASSVGISALKSLVEPGRHTWTMQITPTPRAIRLATSSYIQLRVDE